MAGVEQCHAAIERLGAMLDSLDADTRTRLIPDRTIGCVVSDLDVGFVGRLDADGLHDLRECSPVEVKNTEVRANCSSDELVALAAGEDTFVSAWLHGRVGVSASVRDVLRLRSLIGL